MKIVDNFLPSSYQDAIENLLLSADFPWYLNPYTLNPTKKLIYANKNSVEDRQFTHAFVRDGNITSNSYPLISLIPYHLMLTENIRTDSVHKVKANLNLPLRKYPENSHFIIHTDLPLTQTAITCVYYVNDCNGDGDTILFDEKGVDEIFRVSPKKGRLVYFDSKIPHVGCPPKSDNTRCLINFNFKL